METLRKSGIHSLAAAAAIAMLMAAPQAIAQAGCANCGTVASVKAVQQKPKTSKIGMIGGGAVGALLGNELGDGNVLATAGGAVGGAYLGNKVGQKMQSKTRYKVTLRMDNGGTRSVTYAQRPNVAIGSHVRLENGRLMPA
jgi:outer membrane lipoprotein SlyB